MELCYFHIPVLTPADAENHIDKHRFTVPFVCGARSLGEALRRIAEGAAMIRTKGEAGTGTGYCLYTNTKVTLKNSDTCNRTFLSNAHFA